MALVNGAETINTCNKNEKSQIQRMVLSLGWGEGALPLERERIIKVSGIKMDVYNANGQVEQR
jgi:hypothetical protein